MIGGERETNTATERSKKGRKRKEERKHSPHAVEIREAATHIGRNREHKKATETKRNAGRESHRCRHRDRPRAFLDLSSGSHTLRSRQEERHDRGLSLFLLSFLDEQQYEAKKTGREKR